MSESHGSDRTHMLYERTRVIEQALQTSELELEEVAGQVRVALADLRRAERSWGAGLYHRLGGRSGPAAGAANGERSALRRAIAALTELDQRLSQHSRSQSTPRS